MSDKLIDQLKAAVREDLPSVFNFGKGVHPKDQAIIDGILKEMGGCDDSFLDLSDLLVEKHNVYDFEELYRMIAEIACVKGL